MQELIQVENTPAHIDVNFEALKKHLDGELKKYRVVVTGDTVKDAKKVATDINALRKEIDTRRKEEVAKASEPVKAFDGKMKELVAMCDTGRKEILDQVKKFEDETRQLASQLLHDAREDLWKKLQVEDEYKSAEFDDLILLSSVTGTGKLAASAKQKLEQRVSEDKALQDRTKVRLVELENKSWKADLAAPLTRDHVQHFLFADEETYNRELQRILDAEIERQAAAEQRMKQQEEKRRQQEEAAKHEAQARQERMEKQEQEKAPEPEPTSEPTAASKPEPKARTSNQVVITCKFHVNVPDGTPDEVIKRQLRAKMEAAGFSSLASIEIEETEGAAA